MPSLGSRLLQVLPPDRILNRSADRAAYDSDAQTAYRCRGAAVAIPRSGEELIAVVRWCQAKAVPFVVRGSGTGLSAASTPIAEGVVIVTTALNRIHSIDPVRRVAVVEAGVVNADISRAAAQFGLFFAPDPSSQPICTIGGNIGFNAGGAHCLKHGMTSNHVLAIRAVLGTGDVVEWGTGGRDHIGPDWTGFFVGNEGLFGAVIEATVNLLPLPDGCHTVLAGFASTDAAGDAVSAIIASGLVPVAMELMDDLTIEAVKPVVPIDYPPNCHALLLVELDGPVAVVSAEKDRLENLLREQGSTGLVIAADATERANIWRVRKSAYGRFAPNNFVQDSVVPRRHLGEALRRIAQISDTYELTCPNVCHAGDGNLHPNLLYDGKTPGAFERAEKAAGEILKMSVELGGSITGEHGVGLEKKNFLSLMYGPAELGLFHRIRRCFDPDEIANPGKLLPSQPAASKSTQNPRKDFADVAEWIKTQPHIVPRGGGTKSTGLNPPSATFVTSTLSGITDYEPAEFIVTALAGTSLTEINAELDHRGQQLLFDPPLASRGATLGGTIAAGLNGPGALSGGRIRDAMLGATFIDGSGTILTVGSKVVKNVAGFDVPKLLVGSLGGFGLLTEVTLKVRPKEESSQILEFVVPDQNSLIEKLTLLNQRTIRPAAIETDPDNGKIWARFEAPSAALEGLIDDLRAQGANLMDEAAASNLWKQLHDLSWADPQDSVAKIPVGMDRMLDFLRIVRPDCTNENRLHLSLGGDTAYLGTASDQFGAIRAWLSAANFGSMALWGAGPRLIPAGTRSKVWQQLKETFDPDRRFPPLFD